MNASKSMWIIQPLLSVTILHVLEVTSAANSFSPNVTFVTNSFSSNVSKPRTEKQTSEAKPDCILPNPLVYGIICFLASIIVILLILLFQVFKARHGIRVNTIENRELTPVCQNEAFSVHPTSANGADDSSSTSSESRPGSLASSQRYVSLQERRKTSDYINIVEGASAGQVEFKNEETGKDYVNVNEPRKKMFIKRPENCDDGTTSISSDSSVESLVNYSKVVFTKAEK